MEKVLNVTGSMAGTLGKIQPFRYRGYVYDVETGLYYLRSRYYGPTIARFFSADSIIGFNLFNYCNNNPVCLFDANGKDPDWVRRKVAERGYLLPAEATEIITGEGGTTYTPEYYVSIDGYYDAEAAKRMNVYASRSTNSEVLVSDIKKYSLMYARTIENDYEWLEVIFVYEDGILCRQGYAKADDVYVRTSGGTVSCKDNENDGPINVRVKPGRSKIKYRIQQDTYVSVIGQKNNYYWISTEQGCGWINMKYLNFA